MEYVIYLSNISPSNLFNDYGYWSGKTYKQAEETFPVCDLRTNQSTKVYKSKIRAENMAQKLMDRCGYVTSWNVEEFAQNMKEEE